MITTIQPLLANAAVYTIEAAPVGAFHQQDLGAHATPPDIPTL